ncbi:MAG: orotidine-5'-phosphate decarboxylase [Betaproteobacteria bacterium]|nr:orotidine-5'-phosphate decarboxylase [Betaproteobacteria bacterium]
MESLLSKKQIPVRERLIFALDYPDVKEAEKIIETLGDSVQFYKLGLEIFMADGYFKLIDELHKKGKKVFVDLKFFDVPNTVASAVRQLKNRHAEFVTVHGSDKILEAACNAKSGVKILAVTVLTSLCQEDIESLGFQSVKVEDLVYSRAKRALEIGCDGVISSGLEISRLRKELGDKLLIVVPGIRPVENTEVDDQKRTVNVETAFNNGADYIVVGRPIKKALDPKQAAEDIQSSIAKVFAAS